MRVQGAIGRNTHPTSQSKPAQNAASPLRGALRIGCFDSLQTATMAKIYERLPVEQDKMTRTVKSSPIVIAEEAAVQRVNVWRLDKDETT